MRSNGYRWPDELWAQAKSLIDDGKTIAQAAKIIGCEYQALKAKLRWERSGPQLRKERAAASRARRGERLRSRPWNKCRAPSRIQFDRASPRPADQLVAERDYRLSLAPRDLTAVLMGDPPPGYSALERRV